VNATQIDHESPSDNSDLNGNPGALPLITQRWDLGAGAYNNQPSGLWYNAGRWRVFNNSESLPPMPVDAGFHVLIPTSNPFLPLDYAARIKTPVDVGALEIDLPSFHNRSCAHVFVTSVFGDPQDNVNYPGVHSFQCACAIHAQRASRGWSMAGRARRWRTDSGGRGVPCLRRSAQPAPMRCR
jgi:hypothetical protein